MQKLVVLLTPEQKEFVHNIANEQGLSQGAIVRILIEEKMKENNSLKQFIQKNFGNTPELEDLLQELIRKVAKEGDTNGKQQR